MPNPTTRHAEIMPTPTERQLAEALHVAERRVRALFHQSPWGIISYAPNGDLLDANQAALDTMRPEQTAGYNVLKDERLAAAGLMDGIRRAFAGEATRLAPLYFRPSLDSTPPEARGRWLRGFLYPVLDDAGAVSEVVAMAEDITEQVESYHVLEQHVAERTRELSTVLEVAHTVASTLDLRPLLGLILDHLKSIVDYSGATIQTLDDEQLTVLDYRGPLPREKIVGLRFALERGGNEYSVIHERRPIIADDVHGQTALIRAYHAASGQTPNHVRSWMGVPLLLKERVIGLLTLAFREPNHYTPHHATLALAMANQAAVAMENARLYQQAQHIAAQDERQRLARDLHDAVTQTLFSASLIAEMLPRLWEQDPDAGRRHLEDVRLLTLGALAEMRMLLLELRPSALTDTKLADLLRQLAAALTGRKRLPVTLRLDGDRAVPPDVQVALYRVAQEALNNIAKHARATAVELRLRSGERGVALSINDNGRGFDTSGIGADHFGLRIMRERADSIGARLSVRSRPGAGTCIRVVWRERGEKGG